MTIKKLFKTESEFLDYAWSFIDFDENKIWREEDLPILQPFFDYRAGGPMTEEVKKGFDLWEKRRLEYADDLFELRDSLRLFEHYDLYDFFFLKSPPRDCWDVNENGEEIDENGDVMEKESRENLRFFENCGIKFPMVFIGWIDSGWSRVGDEKVMFSEWVSLKDFEDKN